jgi:hypothetical protein
VVVLGALCSEKSHTYRSANFVREGEPVEQHHVRVEKFILMNCGGSSTFDKISWTLDALYKKLTKPGAIG